MSRGTWLSSFQTGVAADKPGHYFSDADIMIYFASDTGVLSVAARPTSGTTATWTDVASGDALTLLSAIPTTDQTDGATVWNDAGVLKVSTAPA